MSITRIHRILHKAALFVCAAALLTTVTFARSDRSSDASSQRASLDSPNTLDATAYQTNGMTLEQAVAMVQSRYGARALKFNTVEEDGRRIHYIRLITADKSRVWTVRVDAATGREF